MTKKLSLIAVCLLTSLVTKVWAHGEQNDNFQTNWNEVDKGCFVGNSSLVLELHKRKF